MQSEKIGNFQENFHRAGKLRFLNIIEKPLITLSEGVCQVALKVILKQIFIK